MYNSNSSIAFISYGGISGTLRGLFDKITIFLTFGFFSFLAVISRFLKCSTFRKLYMMPFSTKNPLKQ